MEASPHEEPVIHVVLYIDGCGLALYILSPQWPKLPHDVNIAFLLSLKGH